MSRNNAKSHVDFGAWSVPAARLRNIIIHESEVEGEILIYDQGREHMHHLNAVATTVWRLCDGSRSVNALAADTTLALGIAVNEKNIRIALTKLDDANLLDAPLPAHLRVTGTDRRRFIKRMAAGSLVVPVINSVSAPKAAAAGSGCVSRGDPCLLDEQCCGDLVCRGEFRGSPGNCNF